MISFSQFLCFFSTENSPILNCNFPRIYSLWKGRCDFVQKLQSHTFLSYDIYSWLEREEPLLLPSRSRFSFSLLSATGKLKFKRTYLSQLRALYFSLGVTVYFKSQTDYLNSCWIVDSGSCAGIENNMINGCCRIERKYMNKYSFFSLPFDWTC